MSNTIEAKVIDGEMWVRAADHQRVLDRAHRMADLAHEAGRAAGAAAERERIIAANAPEIERCNAHIGTLTELAMRNGPTIADAIERAVRKEREAMVALAAKQGWAMKNEDPFEDCVREIADMRARSNT